MLQPGRWIRDCGSGRNITNETTDAMVYWGTGLCTPPSGPEQPAHSVASANGLNYGADGDIAKGVEECVECKIAVRILLPLQIAYIWLKKTSGRHGFSEKNPHS